MEDTFDPLLKKKLCFLLHVSSASYIYPWDSNGMTLSVNLTTDSHLRPRVKGGRKRTFLSDYFLVFWHIINHNSNVTVAFYAYLLTGMYLYRQ